MAMMTWMRRSSRYFLAVVVLTFVASLAYFGATQDRGGREWVARVNGEEIGVGEYQREYREVVEQYRQLLRERFSEELLRSLRVPQQVVDRLVTERLLAQQAAAEGIVVSDAEVEREITRIPAFHVGGRYDRERYLRVLRGAELTPAVFAERLRAELLRRRLQLLIADGVKVSEAEVRRYWEMRHTRVRAAYLLVSPEAVLPQVSVSDAEVEAYYRAHPTEFTRPERRRVLMATLPGSSVPPPPVSEADVEAAYQERIREFQQPERRRLAHILIQVPTVGGSEAEERARASAEAALRRVREGTEFAQVAREVSEDRATAAEGGVLGLVAPGELVEPVGTLAFGLRAGEVGGPVRTAFGYHVVKVLEVVPGSKKELREVAGSLRATLAAEGQLRALRQRAEEVHQALLGARDFAAEARRLGLTVREVGPLRRPDPVEGIGRVPEATEAIFALPPAGVSQPVKVPEGYAIFRLLEREEPKLLPLAEVRAEATQAARRQKAREAAEARARQLVEAARGGEDLAALGRREGLGPGDTVVVSRAQPLSDPELQQALGTAVLQLPLGAVGGPYAGSRGFYVVRVTAREQPDPAQFAQARAQAERELLDAKRAQAWQGWLAALRARAAVEVNRRILPDS